MQWRRAIVPRPPFDQGCKRVDLYLLYTRRFEPGVPYPGWISIDARTAAGRRAIALFHSDKTVTINGSAPRCRKSALLRKNGSG
jgi:hypothetical protein